MTQIDVRKNFELIIVHPHQNKNRYFIILPCVFQDEVLQHPQDVKENFYKKYTNLHQTNKNQLLLLPHLPIAPQKSPPHRFHFHE